jgi:hypothetical protein
MLASYKDDVQSAAEADDEDVRETLVALERVWSATLKPYARQ